MADRKNEYLHDTSLFHTPHLSLGYAFNWLLLMELCQGDVRRMEKVCCGPLEIVISPLRKKLSCRHHR